MQRRIALGVTGVSPDNKQAWLILNFSEDIISECELRISDSMKHPYQELDVEVTVMASPETWLEIGVGGSNAAVKAADLRNIVVRGKLPYFIRNVRSLLDIAVLYATELERTAGAIFKT